jgi:hypothetical protein
MYFDGEYRLLCKVDVTALQAEVHALEESDWLADTSRQEAFAPHRRTQTIGLIYDRDMRHENPTVQGAYDRFRGAVEPIMTAIADALPKATPCGNDPYFVRVILVRLDAGASIGSHRDFGPSLARAHRVHVPVRTNPAAEFGIAGNVRHLPAGEAWEINNRKPHAVRNAGEAPRIHLILDYVIPGEAIDDPDGPILA